MPAETRAQGFWGPGNPMRWAGAWQWAGAVGEHEAAGFWWDAQPLDRWPDDPDWGRGVMANWQEPFGDRRQEIVFIGIGMEEGLLRIALDACLLSDEEMRGGPRAWGRFADPFPAWRQG